MNAPVLPPPSGLVLDFDGVSWVEVRDASDSVVLVGEFPAGTKHSVIGKSPFRLWIGRASAVRVSNRGVAVDLKSSSREDVARLTLE